MTHTHCESGQRCQTCHMPLIHQANRQMGESSTSIGQYVRGLPRDFGFTDVDGVVMRGNTMRIIEHKWDHSSMSSSQYEALEWFARLLDLAVQAGWLSPESGVYILRTGINPEYPSVFTAGRITKLIPGQSEDRFTVDEIGIQQLMSGQPITTNARQLTL